MRENFDRSTEDMGNIVGLEHVNVQVGDQRLATLFYVSGLGLTRDPYLQVGVTNMWINVGRSQFHLPTREPQVLRGRIGLVMPNLDALVDRLESVREPLEDTKFDFVAPNGNDLVEVTCPWGNRFRCHEAGGKFDPMGLGMPYVQFDVPTGASDGIARFYDHILGAPSRIDDWDGARSAIIQAGFRQELVFRETDAPLAPFDEHHIQIYVTDFSGPYNRLKERGLISQESNQHQYRFVKIVDPDSGEDLFEIDHEVRSMTHPLWGRPFVNRNPASTNQTFAAGYEHRSWAVPWTAQ
ncbi:MAG: hypothetical protein O3C34_19025 [Proteobacteria bacterium]|nr:hypothetical protein [Pseudomonadota bacterium]